MSTPWGRLVCEFMAQQTQIARVAERWPLMMDKFPTPNSMATQDLQVVLAIWQGLGYYRRASYLKRTAEMIVEKFGGEVPSSIESLLQLPGVGKYTAGAIASIAFGEKEPIVDGNVHRVLCRLSDKGDSCAPCVWSWKKADIFVQSCNDPSIFNEGLMELGATICTSKSPRCEACPVRAHCESWKSGTQNEIPSSRTLKSKKRIHHHAVVLTCNNEVALEQRDADGLWGGMWQVPTVESTKEMLISTVAKTLGIDGTLIPIGSFKHILTHRVVEFNVYSCEIEREARFKWYSIDALDDIPLASAQRKVLAVHCRA